MSMSVLRVRGATGDGGQNLAAKQQFHARRRAQQQAAWRSTRGRKFDGFHGESGYDGSGMGDAPSDDAQAAASIVVASNSNDKAAATAIFTHFNSIDRILIGNQAISQGANADFVQSAAAAAADQVGVNASATGGDPGIWAALVSPFESAASGVESVFSSAGSAAGQVAPPPDAWGGINTGGDIGTVIQSCTTGYTPVLDPVSKQITSCVSAAGITTAPLATPTGIWVTLYDMVSPGTAKPSLLWAAGAAACRANMTSPMCLSANTAYQNALSSAKTRLVFVGVALAAAAFFLSKRQA